MSYIKQMCETHPVNPSSDQATAIESHHGLLLVHESLQCLALTLVSAKMSASVRSDVDIRVRQWGDCGAY